MRVLYLGEGKCFRPRILERQGHLVDHFYPALLINDPNLLFAKFFLKCIRKLQGTFYDSASIHRLEKKLKLAIDKRKKYDCLFLVQPSWISRNLLKWLKLHSPHAKVICYSTDDITGRRDSNRFKLLLRLTDLVDQWYVSREVNILEMLAYGAKSVERIWMGFDSTFHNISALRQTSPADFAAAKSIEKSLLFVGTNIPGEDRFATLSKLAKNHPVIIVGQRWPRPRQGKPNSNPIILNYIVDGIMYSAFLSKSLGVVGFLSHGNRDLHTSRSFEVIACGGVLIAEATSEHQLLYENNYEVLLWNNNRDLIRRCNDLISSRSYPPAPLAFIRNNLSTVFLQSYDLNYAFKYMLPEGKHSTGN